MIRKLSTLSKGKMCKTFVVAILVSSLLLSPLHVFAEDENDDYWNGWGNRPYNGEHNGNDDPNHTQEDDENEANDDENDNENEDTNDNDTTDETPEPVAREPWLTTQELPPRQEGLNMVGVIPVLLPTFGEGYVYANQRIEEVVASLIGDARRMRARSITFNHEWHETEEVVSIVIYASITSVISRVLVRSVNFCPYTGELLTMAEVAEAGVIPLATRILTDRMRRQPEQFYAAQSITLTDQAFFINYHGLTILFDEFQLSAMVSGYVSLELANSNMRRATIALDETYHPTDNNYNLLMVPLREVAGQLGFDVVWNSDYGQAELWRPGILGTGQRLIWMTPGLNVYHIWVPPGSNGYHTPDMQRALEAAPLLANDILYVPITFFEQILPLSVYSIDGYGNVTFLMYT